MAQATLTRVLDDIKTLEPEELRLVEAAVQSQLVQPDIGRPSAESTEKNAWDVLEELIGTVTAPADWAEEHDHYLYGTPKRRTGGSASEIVEVAPVVVNPSGTPKHHTGDSA